MGGQMQYSFKNRGPYAECTSVAADPTTTSTGRALSGVY
jgi:hypothetical protein